LTYTNVYDIMKLNDAKNGIYSAAELGSIWVPNEMLPESYHDEREGGRSLDRLQQEARQEPAEVDAREKSVVISHGKIMSGNQERVNILNQYQNDADTESEIDYSINEYRLYRNEQAFAKAIGLDLEEEEV
jgi:hypothetical protein